MRIPEDGQQKLLTMKTGFWLRWRLFTWRSPKGVLVIILVEYPGFVTSDNRLKKVLPVRAQQQTFTNADTGCIVVVGQSMGRPSRQHFAVAHGLQVAIDGAIVMP